VAAAVWAEPARVPMIALGFAAVSRYLQLEPPPSGGPGPFAMADPEQLADEFARAGLRDVEVQELVVPFRLASPSDVARFTRAVLPPGMAEIVEDLCTEETASQLWAAVADAAAPLTEPSGSVDLTSVTWCVRGVRR
jgi:enediyne biosynthesis protein CalE5